MRFGIRLCIAMNKSYSELLSTGYIYKVRTEETLHRSVVKGKRTKQMNGQKKTLKFCIFIIRDRFAIYIGYPYETTFERWPSFEPGLERTSPAGSSRIFSA
jgi:hypothetical protein